MSKVDAQRAMREARYAALQATAAARPARPGTSGHRSSAGTVSAEKVPAQEAPTQTAPTQRGPAETIPATPAQRRGRAGRAAATDPDGSGEAALCGHRNIGNKSCQRPAGHPEKNHRYK